MKILIVDNSKTCAQKLQQDIEALFKPEVAIARSFDEAQCILLKEKFDLILLDLTLPDTAGPVDTLEKIKPLIAEIPSIVVTGLPPDPGLDVVAKATGINCVLRKKEVTPAVLRTALELALVLQRHEQNVRYVRAAAELLDVPTQHGG